MLNRLLLIGLLLCASAAQAKVYRCVDPNTGKTTFTDVACASNTATQDQVRVKPHNFGGNGHHAAGSPQKRVWRSQDPTRRDELTPQGTQNQPAAQRTAVSAE